MQHDVSSSSSTSGSVPVSESDITKAERQFTEYASEVGDTVSSRAGEVYRFMADRPLLVGSIAAAGIGAVVGSRIGHMVAMRRKKTSADRLVEMLGVAMPVISGMVSREAISRAASRMADRGRDVVKSSREMNLPSMESLPVGRKNPGFLSRIGYALSLVPVGMALIRNPLVRNVGLRFLARRVKGGGRRRRR